VPYVRRRGPGKRRPTLEEQSLEHEDRDGMNPGEGALRRMYTVDGHLPSDQHGVTRRPGVDRISPEGRRELGLRLQTCKEQADPFQTQSTREIKPDDKTECCNMGPRTCHNDIGALFP
jgi:hypothetical protein